MPTIAETYKMLEEYPNIIRGIIQRNAEIHSLMSALNQNCIMITANYGKMASMPKLKQASDPTYYAYQQAEMLNKTYQDKIGHTVIKILSMVQDKTKIDLALEKLTSTERNVVILRCFERMPWDKLSEKLLYSERQCRRIKNIAVRKVASNIE
jgi:hypothetical protein